MAILVAVPLAAFVISAAAGHLSMNGDNWLQNFPLRVLVGTDLRSGHLPLWDPYLWSGTPLLAGFNAGAAYPLTLLFAFLPPLTAWLVTQVALYATAAVGTYVFFRDCGRSVAAALAAAASFAFAGFLSSQIGHVDAIQAAALLPWLLFTLRRAALAERHRGCWAALLGLGVGIVILAASPQTIVDDIIAVAFYVIWLCLAHRSRAPSILAFAVAAGVVGVALGSIQWLPGIDWEGQSQRVGAAYQFFASGSLPPRLTILSVLPWLIGGYGNFGTAYYAGPYNLAELNGYVGMLPLMAGCGLLATRFRRHPKRAEWLGWYALVALGLVLAWGGDTPIGHVLHAIPLYGQQRDQSRNLLLVDLGLVGLLASWIDVAIAPLRAGRSRKASPADVAEGRLKPAGATLGAGESPLWPARLRRTEVAWALLPVLGVLAVWAYFLVAPASVAAKVSARGLGRLGASQVDLSVAAAIAVAAAASVVLASRLKPLRRMAFIGAVIAIDLLVYGAQQYSFATVPTSVLTGSNTAERALAAAAGPGRRIAFEDPALLPSLTQLGALGLPDVNIIERVPSANGYGSLASATYNTYTGTHNIATIAFGAFSNGTLAQLDVGVLAIPGPSLTGSGSPPPDLNLSGPLKAGGWVAAGSLDGFSLWRPTRSRGPVWTVPTGSTLSPAPTISHLHQGAQDAWTMDVASPAPVEVVRSVAYAPGWSAVLTGPAGRSRTVRVVEHGLVQAAFVPAGVTHISWRYTAPGIDAGIVLTALGALGLVGLAMTDSGLSRAAWRRRLRRQRPRDKAGGVTPAPRRAGARLPR